jgi:hypothetical protein
MTTLAERLIQLARLEAAAAPDNLSLQVADVLMAMVNSTEVSRALRPRLVALLLEVFRRTQHEWSLGIVNDLAPLVAGKEGVDVGSAIVARLRAVRCGVREPDMREHDARMWLRAAGALERGGVDPSEALTQGLIAGKQTFAAGRPIGASASLGAVLAARALDLAGSWPPLARAALEAWLLDDFSVEERRRRAPALSAVLLAHRSVASSSQVGVVRWLELEELRKLQTPGPRDATDLFDEVVVRFAQLGEPAHALALLEQHPSFDFGGRNGLRLPLRRTVLRLLPHLCDEDARVLVERTAHPHDPFFHLEPEIMVRASDAEIEQHIARRDDFGWRLSLMRGLPPRHRHRRTTLIGLVQDLQRDDDDDGRGFQLIRWVDELPSDVRDDFVRFCVDFLETKIAGRLACYDGCDVAVLVPALSTAVCTELVNALDSLLSEDEAMGSEPG